MGLEPAELDEGWEGCSAVVATEECWKVMGVMGQVWEVMGQVMGGVWAVTGMVGEAWEAMGVVGEAWEMTGEGYVFEVMAVG